MQREPLSLPVLIGTCVVLSVVLASMPIRWPHGDFIEYWAAGRLNAAGRNPYDPAALLIEEQQAGLTEAKPVVMYNPPWTLALAMPFGAMNFALARSLWAAVQIVTLLWCASRLWLLYGGEPRYTIRACCVALVWGPALSALNMGQVSTVMLAGLVGFVQSVSRRRDIAAGAWVAATLLKPQLLALVWVALLLWVITGRRWKVPGGIAATVIMASLAALVPNHHVFAQYQDLMTSAPPTATFESPSISSILQVFAHAAGSWPQYLPTIAGVCVMMAIWYRRRHTWDIVRELPWLITASLFVTAYGGWSFDLVLLLVPILAVGAALVRRGDAPALLTAGVVFACVSAVTVEMMLTGVPQQLWVWVTPVVAIACRQFWRRARRAAPPRPAPGSSERALRGA
ncbi:MAG: glycosyltransferase family 87 protein [Candidatus Dormibacteria bacterium]